MNAARIENSQRLRRVAALLADGEEHSTMDIIARARVCAVNSICFELRTNGYNIRCVRRGNIWYYHQIFE